MNKNKLFRAAFYPVEYRHIAKYLIDKNSYTATLSFFSDTVQDFTRTVRTITITGL